MSPNNTNRRSFLRTVGAAGAISTGALAGCIDLGDDDDDDDDETPPDNGTPPEDDPEPFPEIDFLYANAATNSQRNTLGDEIIDNMEELGFDVNAVPMDFDPHVERAVIEQDFDISLLGWGGTPERIDPHIFLTDMHHPDFAGEGGRNTPGYDNPEYTDIAEAQAVEVDPDERQELVMEAQEILAEDQPRCYIANEGGDHPYNSDTLDSVNPTLGEGLNGFWHFVDMEPADGVEEVVMGYPADIISLNPLQDLATPDRQFIRLLYDQLYRFDEGGDPTPWLAEDDVEVSDDGLEYTCTLRDDHEFHDGEPVTVDDVVFSYEMFGEYSPTYATYLEPLEEIETNGNEITFHLSEVDATFGSNALAQIYIFPEHIWEDIDDPTDEDDEDYIGSGPFMFDDWEREVELQLDAYEDHFYTPNVDRLIRVPGDEDTLFDELEAGAIDFVGSLPTPAQWEDLDDVDHVSFAQWDAIGHVKLAYNMRRDHMDDVHVRRAISHCVPKEDFIEHISGGMGTVTHSPIAPVLDQWHNPDVREYYEDLDAAEAELEEGGYVWEDGMIHYPAE